MPFFFKQWGGVRKSETGRELDGRTHDDQPDKRDRPKCRRIASDCGCVESKMLNPVSHFKRSFAMSPQ